MELLGDAARRGAKVTPFKRVWLLAQAAPLLLAIEVALHPPTGWEEYYSPHAVELAFMLILYASAWWIPALSISNAWRVLEGPLLKKTRAAMAIGAAEISLGVLVLSVGEFRKLPFGILLASALTIAVGELIISTDGVISMTRLSSVEYSPFEIKASGGWSHVLGVALLAPITALVATHLTRTLAVAPDPRWWAALAGATPGPALAMAWCVRARRELNLMRGEEGKLLCMATFLSLLSAVLLSLSFLLSPRVVWLAAALTVVSASGIMFDRAVTYWSLNSLFQRVSIFPKGVSKGVILIEAEPAAYTGRLLAALSDLLAESTSPILLLTRRGSRLAELLRRTGRAVLAYLTTAPVSHPRALDEEGREYEVGMSVPQLSALVNSVTREMGAPITLIVDSFNDLATNLGVREAYSLLRVLSDLTLGEGGRVVVISFPSALAPREAAVVRTLATEILLV